MTDTADYQQTIRIQASPGALFDAITTASALSAWWSPASGSGHANGELEFFMNVTEPLKIHVDEAIRPTTVRWSVTECSFLPEWVGTRPVFTITRTDGGASELHFRHLGLTPDLDCNDMCTRSWDHYLASLRDYIESGHGTPRYSAGDDAWRAGTF